MKQLRLIPRVESKAPQKNTIEWEIPNEVLVSIMVVESIGWLMVAKVKKQKKSWWNRVNEKIFMESGANIDMILRKGLVFLNKFSYSIDFDDFKEGEQIGNPEYFKEVE